MYKICIINKPAYSRYSLPVLWSSAKTYFEENGQYRNEWTWADPIVSFTGNEDTVNNIVADRPKVIGISVYIWNELFSHDIAKQLKQLLPDSIIVFGGPQCDIKFNQEFFKQYPYVDLVIPGDAYGELALTNILDNVSANSGRLNPVDLPYAYYPNEQREIKFNTLAAKKKDYRWPKNPYRAQEATLKPILENFPKDQGTLWITIETSRGCPYKCSFCDWGGGTYTKTVKKPFGTVLDEITWAGENHIHGIYFTDANFGMYDIDIEYAKHIVNVAKTHGFPKQVYICPTKVKLHNLYKIYELLAGADLLSHYQISIQDLDDNVKKNVDRIDFSFEEQVSMFKRLQEIKYLPVYIECILGLPGSSIDTIKESVQRISLEKLPFPVGHHWILLPETPAYHPDFRAKFQLKTIKGKSSDGIGATSIIKQKADREGDQGVNYSKTKSDDISTEYVVGSFSYTTDEWVEMNQLQVFVSNMQQTRILDLIADYMWQEYQIKYGDFFYTCLKTVLEDTRVDAKLQTEMNKLTDSIYAWLEGSQNDVYTDYHDDFSFELSPIIYYMFVVLVNTDAFFDSVLLAIAKLVTVDDKIKDLCNYSRNRLLDITYRPGRKFTTQFDWSKYIQSGSIVPGDKTYEVQDVEVLSGGKWFDIDWVKYQGTVNYYTHYVYRVCYDYKTKKTANNIIEINE